MEPHPYRQALAARDLDRLVSLFADDAIFHSPIFSEPGLEGRDSVAALLETVALEVFKDNQYTHDLGDERSHVLVADTRVNGKPIKTTTLLEFDAQGKIREVWIMARPLTGLIALAEAVGRLAASAGAALSEPVAGLAAVADRAETFDGAAARVARDLNRSTRSGAL